MSKHFPNLIFLIYRSSVQLSMHVRICGCLCVFGNSDLFVVYNSALLCCSILNEVVVEKNYKFEWNRR